MAKEIEPKLKSIGEYLKLDEEIIFHIPEYQRAYSWGTDRCDKLWQDILDFSESDSKDSYFFGTIIINCKDDKYEYSLIDGQQRTTSFLLLLKALLVRINEALENFSKDEDSIKLFRGLQERRREIIGILYKCDTEDITEIPSDIEDEKIYMSVNLINNDSINEQYKDELQNILRQKDFFSAEKKAYKIPYKRLDNKYSNFFRNYKQFYYKIKDLQDSQLNKISTTILKKCQVIEIKSWKVEQAITMFNSLNSDGLPLFDSDIISAKLFAAARGPEEQEIFKIKWKELNENIEEFNLNKCNFIDLNSILMQYMYYIRVVNKETISESGSIIVTMPGLRRYFTDINPTLINEPITMCNNMLNLIIIWGKILDYPALQVLMKFNDNFKLFLASYFSRFKETEVTEENFKTIIECLLRIFAILEIEDIGYSSNKFKTFLFGLQIKLVDDSVKIDEIKNIVDEHIISNWNRENIKSAIENCNNNSLVYLNEYLVAEEFDKNFILGISHDIEHIMPGSGNNILTIRNDAQIDTEEEFKNIVNKLGNKIILESKINRSIGNQWFRTKVSTNILDKTGYVNSIYPIASKLVETYKLDNKPYWTKVDIDNATKEASERITKFIFDK